MRVAAATQSNWMSLQQLQSELERERTKYEVKATDPQGQRVELDVDPVTGDILKTEVKRKK